MLFTKKLKPWFKPFRKKAAVVTKPVSLKLHSMSHKQLTMYADRVGIGVCSMPNSYATELAMKMMDVLYQFNEAHTKLRTAPKREKGFALHNNLAETRSEVCQWLNRIANHYMQTEKDYIKALSKAGFEITHSEAPMQGNVPVLRKRKKQL